MAFKNFDQISQSLLDLVQAGLLPVLGVCLAVSILFLILQIVFSFHDFTLQFLVRIALVAMVLVFTAKSLGQRYIEFTKDLYTSAAGLVR